MGMMKGGKGNARHSSRAYSLRLNGTALGQVIPLIYGQTRSTPKLIWAGDFNSSPVNSGKKSGKGGGGGGVFQYTIAADFLIGHRPLRGVLTAWVNKSIFILNYCDVTFVCPANGTITLGPTPNITYVGWPTGSPGEQYTIPGSDQLSVVNAASFAGNTQVIYTSTQAKLTQVALGSALTQGQYTVDANGLYTFSAADIGQSVQISYSYFAAGAGPPIVYILGVTAEIPINVTFNDFGAPGPRTVQGTSAMPLWDERFALPLSDSDITPTLASTSPANRRPYTFWADGFNTTVKIGDGNPGVLAGKNVTIYYAYQAPDPQTGYGTPLANLGLTFEPVLGSPQGNPIAMANEYTNHPDQWCPFTYLSGAGGPDFSLGTSDTIPNLSFETVGLYQLGHARVQPAGAQGNRFAGGACPADVLQDMVSSGPVVVLIPGA